MLVGGSTEHFLKQRRAPAADPQGPKAFVRTGDEGTRKDEYVPSMFSVTWAACLSAFSVAMEDGNGSDKLGAGAGPEERRAMERIEAEATQACLEGFRLGAGIAGLCGDGLARSTFVNALSNFAALGTGKLMEKRHVRCVGCIFDIALEEGEVLGETWEYVFKVVSEVSRLKQVAEHLKADETFIDATEAGGSDDDGDEVDKVVQLSEKAIDEFNAQRVSDAIGDDMIDKVRLCEDLYCAAAAAAANSVPAPFLTPRVAGLPGLR